MRDASSPWHSLVIAGAVLAFVMVACAERAPAPGAASPATGPTGSSEGLDPGPFELQCGDVPRETTETDYGEPLPDALVTPEEAVARYFGSGLGGGSDSAAFTERVEVAEDEVHFAALEEGLIVTIAIVERWTLNTGP